MRWSSEGRRRAGRILLVILTSSVLPNCFAHSRNPLSDLKDSKLDKRLLGHWVAGKNQFTYIKAAEDGIHGEMHMIGFSPEGASFDCLFGTFFCTSSGERNFLNMSLAAQNPKNLGEAMVFLGYYIWEYEVTPEDGLFTWPMERKLVEKAVNKGDLVADKNMLVLTSGLPHEQWTRWGTGQFKAASNVSGLT